MGPVRKQQRKILKQKKLILPKMGLVKKQHENFLNKIPQGRGIITITITTTAPVAGGVWNLKFPTMSPLGSRGWELRRATNSVLWEKQHGEKLLIGDH